MGEERRDDSEIEERARRTIEAMRGVSGGGPDGEVENKAPWWVHAIVDILWDVIFSIRGPGSGPGKGQPR